MEQLESRTVLSVTLLAVNVEVPVSPPDVMRLPEYSQMPRLYNGESCHHFTCSPVDVHHSGHPPLGHDIAPHDHDFHPEPQPEGEASEFTPETPFVPPTVPTESAPHDLTPPVNNIPAVPLGPNPPDASTLNLSQSSPAVVIDAKVSSVESPLAAPAAGSSSMSPGSGWYSNPIDVYSGANETRDGSTPDVRTAALQPRPTGSSDGDPDAVNVRGMIELEVIPQRLDRGTRPMDRGSESPATADHLGGQRGRQERIFEQSDLWRQAEDFVEVHGLDARSSELVHSDRMSKENWQDQDDGMIELLTVARIPAIKQTESAKLDRPETKNRVQPAEVGLFQAIELAVEPSGDEIPARSPVDVNAADNVFGEIGAPGDIGVEGDAQGDSIGVDGSSMADAPTQAASVFSVLVLAVVTRRLDRRRTEKEERIETARIQSGGSKHQC